MKDMKKVTNTLLSQNIDCSIIQYVNEAIDGLEDKLEIAIAIYIKLCELFWYNPSFVVENDYSLVEDLDRITVNNNEVVCLHWAVIYSRLLDMYNVPNELRGDDEHLMVRLRLNNLVISADATRYGVEDREYVLADLTNTKLGLRICNFKTYSEVRNKELDLIIDRVYEKLGIEYFDDSKLEKIFKRFKKYTSKKIAYNLLNEGCRINKADILFRIRFINNFYSLSLKLREVERLQFFAKYYMRVFDGFSYENCRCITLCEMGESYHLIRLLVLEDDAKNDYYFLETQNGFIEYDKNILIDEFIKRKIYFKYDLCGVLGFTNSEIRRLSKIK